MKFSDLSQQQCEKELEPILSLLGTDSKILDVGAGNGANAEILSRKYSVTAVEPDEMGFELITKKGIPCVKGKLSEVELTEKYDRILFLKFNIPYLDILTSLKKAKSVLADQGIIIWDIRDHEYDEYALQNFSKMFEEVGLGCKSYEDEYQEDRLIISISPNLQTISINSISRKCNIYKDRTAKTQEEPKTSKNPPETTLSSPFRTKSIRKSGKKICSIS